MRVAWDEGSVVEAGDSSSGREERRLQQPLLASLSLRNTGIWNNDRLFLEGVRREQKGYLSS
jgi:hypothetical protein